MSCCVCACEHWHAGYAAVGMHMEAQQCSLVSEALDVLLLGDIMLLHNISISCPEFSSDTLDQVSINSRQVVSVALVLWQLVFRNLQQSKLGCQKGCKCCMTPQPLHMTDTKRQCPWCIWVDCYAFLASYILLSTTCYFICFAGLLHMHLFPKTLRYWLITH